MHICRSGLNQSNWLLRFKNENYVKGRMSIDRPEVPQQMPLFLQMQ